MRPCLHVHRLTASSDVPYREIEGRTRRHSRKKSLGRNQHPQKENQLNDSSETTRAVPDTAPQRQTGTPSVRMCQGGCGQPIPEKRLAAQPNARLCVPCLVAQGDVPQVKRFDEVGRDGEVHQTFFTKDRRIERQINHLNKADVAPSDAFNVVGGGDEHLLPVAVEVIDVGRSLSSVFEYEPSEPKLVTKRVRTRTHIAAVNPVAAPADLLNRVA